MFSQKGLAMATQEERLSILEQKVAALEQQKVLQENRDIALLARIDSFIDDLRRLEQAQIHSFDDLKANQKEIEAAIAILAEAAKDHRQAIELLAQSQKQILALLTRQTSLND